MEGIMEEGARLAAILFVAAESRSTVVPCLHIPLSILGALEFPQSLLGDKYREVQVLIDILVHEYV